MQPLHSRVGVWNSISTWCTLRRWLPVVALATYSSAADAQMPRAQEPVKPMVGGATTPAPAPASANANEKTYLVSFNEETWPKVFDWFSKESGLTYIDTVKPPGTLTLRSDRRYTLPQVLDLLNEALAQKKMVIIRRSQTFLVHPADERLPPELVSMITIDELATRGDTEVVQVIVPLSTVVAEDIAPQMKKLLSSFGTASAFGSDQVIILDKAKNIRNIQHYIKSIEENNKDQFNHQCKYVRASAAAEQLRTLLVDPNTTTNSSTSTQQQSYGQWGGGWGGGGWGQPPQSGGSSRDSKSTQERRFRSVQISVDNPSNTVRLTGPADKVVAARELIKNIDKGDTPRAIGGKEFWKTYNVTPGTAEALAKSVMSLPEFKGSGIQLLAVGTSQVQVYGLPADHIDLESYFKVSADTKPNVTTELVVLNGGDATKMAATISKVLGAKGLIAEARTEGTNAVWMRGTPEDIAEAKLIIRSDPDGGSVGPSNDKIRIIPIDKANSNVLAEEIGRMMNQMGYPTKVNGIGGGEKKSEQPKPMPLPTPGSPMSSRPAEQPNIRKVSAQLVDPQKEAKPSVGITVVGDKIVITGEDPRAVQLAYELLNEILKTGNATTGLEQYTVLKLKNASAVEAAAVINEVFNGPPQQQGGGAPGGGGRGQGGGGALASLNPLNFLSSLTGGASAPTNPSAGRVRVVAEKASNSLIVVKASKLDMLTIKDLLAKAIDNDEPPEGGVARTHMIQLTYAKASDLAPLVRNVYANASGRTASSRPQTPAPFPFGPQPQQQAPQNVALTVEYEDNTNKLIVNCTDAMFAEINKLVTELDKAAKDSAEVVDFVQIKGMSATQIAQAIDALAGRPPVTNTNQRGGQFGGGLGGFGGGQFGGGQFGGGQFGQFGGGLGTPLGGGFNRPLGGGGLGGLGTGGQFGGGMGTGGGGTRGTGGGGTRGGGATGGGGARPGGGGGRQARLDDHGGRLNFDDRDMDVPSALGMLFDPEIDTLETKPAVPDRSALYQVLAEKVRRAYAEPAPQATAHQVSFQQPEQPGGTPPMPLPTPLPAKPPELGSGFSSPSTDVQVIPLETLGGVIIRGKNKAEVDAIKAIISAFQSQVTKTAEINIRIVPMKFQDATTITNELTQVFTRLNFGTGATTFNVGGQQGFGFGLGAQNQQQGSLLLFALPRLNAILLGVPKNREEDIIKEIDKLDIPNDKQLKPVAYPLQRASAQNVATQLQNFFNQRYVGEQLAQNSIRITYDIPNNTVYVQASAADQIDIKDLIEMWDTSKNLSVSDVRVFRLRNAFSDDLSQVLVQTLLANVVNPQNANTAGGLPAGGGVGGVAQAGLGASGGLGGATGGTALGGLQNRPGGAGGALGTLTGGNTGLTTKFVGLRYKSPGGTVESGLLEDVHIVSDARINALVVTAPEKTMKLLESLINELDGVAAAKAFVNVFQLRKADAQVVQQLIINLFSGVNRTGAGGGGLGGLGGLGTQTAQGTTRPLLTLTANPSDGASLIDLRLTADPRTNTLVVAGSQNDIDLIRAVIARLEDTEAPQYMTEVYKLRNAAAADVVTAVQAFLTNEANIVNAQFTATTTYQTLQRQFAMQAEPVSNTILVSATPQLFSKIMNLIERVDATPPQVFVQVLIADVQLTSNEEMGVEIGLQSNVLFARGQVASGTSTGAAPGTPGFNFNTTAPLPNSNNFAPGLVGFQGLGNLGVGRAGTAGVGGFVFSASNDTFSLLVRALKSQGRLDVLSRPQLLLTDNQTGFFQVGQNFPLPGATTITNGLAQTEINYVNIGIVLRVTPRISPDGRILMRIEPNISQPGNPVLVNGALQPVIDTQTVETTVLANDGETIVLGGLIRKTDQKTENKIPVLGDLPYLGTAFRYRTQQQTRRELLFIMTPHIVRNEEDMKRLVADEARKMSWSLKDVDCVHGHGMDVLSAGRGGPGTPGYCPPGANPGAIPAPGSGLDGQPIPIPTQPPATLPAAADARKPNPLFEKPQPSSNAAPGTPGVNSIHDKNWNPISTPPLTFGTTPTANPVPSVPTTPTTKAKEGQASWESVKR
jgi:type II secretion system protein D